DVDALKRLGARGVVRPSANTLQVVIGPIADQVASDIRRALVGSGAVAAAPVAASEAPASVASAEATLLPESTLRRVVAALGGSDNIRSIEPASTRVRVNVVDATLVDRSAMSAIGLRGMAMAAPDWVHLLV